MGCLLPYTIGLSLVIVLMCIINSSAAIQCYECNSYTDKRCLGDENNKLHDELKKSCKTENGRTPILCRKIKQTIDFEVNGMHPESRVIRTCGWDNSSYFNRCYQRSGFGGRQEVCSCSSDNCNGSTNLIASTSLVLSLGLVVLIKLNLL